MNSIGTNDQVARINRSVIKGDDSSFSVLQHINQHIQRDLKTKSEDITHHGRDTRGKSNVNHPTVVLFLRCYPQGVVEVRTVSKKPFIIHVQGILKIFGHLNRTVNII